MAKTSNWKQPYHQVKKFLAKVWYQVKPNLTTIAITGSYGKTNTATAITSTLSQKFATLQTDLNLDTVYNLPKTLLKIRPTHQKLVLELGVDHKGEMDSYLKLIQPKIAVITGINPTHSEPELLGSVETIVEEKGKLLEALPSDGWAVMNKDDEKVVKMAKKTKAKIIWYGLETKANYQAENIKVSFQKTEFVLKTGKEKISLKTGLIGRHFVAACLAAAIVGRISGLSWEEIKKGIAGLKPLKGRGSIETGPKGSILINDALRANPASTLAGLKLLAQLPTKGKRIAVLGEMGELGKSADKEHQQIGQEISKLKIDYLIGVGPLQKLTISAAKKGFWAKDVEEAAKILEKILKKGDLLYLKGSLLRHMERILLLLNDEKIGCRVTGCHFYRPCNTCPYKVTGLQSK